VYAQHPDEVALVLDRETTLVWNPTTWHATEPQQPGTRRRAFGWNYGVRGAGTRVRDAAAVRYVFDGEWESWPEARKQLWGVDEAEEEIPAARL
jgi:hypothetical protein